jgi:hypothetical protein
MSRIGYIRPALAALALSGALAACSEDVDIVRPNPSVGGDLFRSYVAMGNSITAGFQSSGINDSTQRESYAALFAEQVGTRYAYPSLLEPGCPPPIENFQTGARVSQPPGRPDCNFRTPGSNAPVLNNVAVPGATIIDPTSTSSPSSNTLTMLVLGGKTQVQRALDADPTFVSIWIGNNDVLAAAVSGLLTPVPGVSPGITPVATFTQRYDQMLDELQAGADRLQGGILIGVVQVAGAPILFPAAVLVNNAQFRAGFEQATGGPVTIHPSCAANTQSLISFAMVPQIRLFRTTPTDPRAHPPLIVCEKNQMGIPAPVGDIFILDATEQIDLAGTVSAYNAHIFQKADEMGFAFFDPNGALADLRNAGLIPIVPNLASPTAPFGDYVSLDGIHPAGPAHVLVANGIIQAVNDEYGVDIPEVTVP